MQSRMEIAGRIRKQALAQRDMANSEHNVAVRCVDRGRNDEARKHYEYESLYRGFARRLDGIAADVEQGVNPLVPSASRAVAVGTIS